MTAMTEDRETVDAYRQEGLGARAPFRATSLHAFQACTEINGEIPAWLHSRWSATGLAILATGWFTISLLRKRGGVA